MTNAETITREQLAKAAAEIKGWVRRDYGTHIEWERFIDGHSFHLNVSGKTATWVGLCEKEGIQC